MSEQLPPNEVYQDIVKRFWDKKWPSVSQHDIENAWDNYVEGVERLANAEPVVSEVQLQAIREQAISVLVNFMNDAVQWGAESYNPPRVILEHPGSQIDARADEILSAVVAVLEGKHEI